MTLEELEAEVIRLKAVQEIQNLQAKWGFLVQRRPLDNWDEIIELFTDDATIEIGDSGVYVGREGVESGEGAC